MAKRNSHKTHLLLHQLIIKTRVQYQALKRTRSLKNNPCTQKSSLWSGLAKRIFITTEILWLFTPSGGQLSELQPIVKEVFYPSKSRHIGHLPCCQVTAYVKVSILQLPSCFFTHHNNAILDRWGFLWSEKALQRFRRHKARKRKSWVKNNPPNTTAIS